MKVDLTSKQTRLKNSDLPAEESERINMECTELLLQIEKKEEELKQAEKDGSSDGGKVCYRCRNL